jgi:hypothetical protein
MVLAYHIFLVGYGHWLPNDPRGSFSHAVHAPAIASLGERHYGMKEVPPSASEMAAFHGAAQQQLGFPVLWWSDQERQSLADAIGELVGAMELTCWACAILSSHLHLLFQRDALRAEGIFSAVRETARERILKAGAAPADHPVFNAAKNHHFKSSTAQIVECIQYIEGNYAKHGLAPVRADWVTEYDGWPLPGAIVT